MCMCIAQHNVNEHVQFKKLNIQITNANKYVHTKLQWPDWMCNILYSSNCTQNNVIPNCIYLASNASNLCIGVLINN